MGRKKIVLGVVPLLLAGWLVSGPVLADDTPPRPGYGWGMMGGGYPGMGPGYGSGYGPGYGRGYGHGMMWGDGNGYGPYGGRGYGPGMHGMMMEPWWALDLNDKQRAAIDKIMEERYKSHWPLMTRMFEAQSRLDGLYNAEKWDSKAINKAYDELFKVQREVTEEHVRIRNTIMEQLTPEQREQLKRYRWERRWRE